MPHVRLVVAEAVLVCGQVRLGGGWTRPSLGRCPRPSDGSARIRVGKRGFRGSKILLLYKRTKRRKRQSLLDLGGGYGISPECLKRNLVLGRAPPVRFNASLGTLQCQRGPHPRCAPLGLCRAPAQPRETASLSLDVAQRSVSMPALKLQGCPLCPGVLEDGHFEQTALGWCYPAGRPLGRAGIRGRLRIAALTQTGSLELPWGWRSSRGCGWCGAPWCCVAAQDRLPW